MVSKMRCNLKNISLVGAALLLLWLIIILLDVLRNTNSKSSKKHSIFELEFRVDSLQNRLSIELEQSNRLLDRIKDQLKKKTSSMGHRVKDDQLHAGSDSDGEQPVLPVLVISCDRVTVSRCLDNLIKYRPSKETFPIIVSQDCGHNHTYNVIKTYTDADPTISVVRQPDLSDIPLPKQKLKFKGYYKIARHFKFALHHVLETLGHEAVIIVEDDLDISPDFFEYFQGTYPLLLKDPSLWCISAWNDNGKRELIDVSQPALLHRTDFFPGLGWLLRRDSWLMLEPKWPDAFFDDWLRDQRNTDGRACIRPEVSRTYSFGKVGVSKGLFFDMHLRYIQLNLDKVQFTQLDLSYLLKENYDDDLDSTVYSLPAVSAEDVVAARAAESDATAVRVPYSDAKSFRHAAKKLGLMDDFRSGIPRTAYRGIVTCYTHGKRVYLAPDFEWTKYDPSWS